MTRDSYPTKAPQAEGRVTDSAQMSAALRRDMPRLVSVVVPTHNEAGNVEPLAAAIADALADYTYELIFVDDSTDETFRRIERLAAGDDRIVGLSLSRRFGHQHALAAGLSRARGQVIITMDGDLQHPPDLLPVLIGKWREGYNVVQALRQDTEEVGGFKRITSRAFYRVFSALCGIRLDPGTSDFRLIDRIVLDELHHMREGVLFLRGLVAWMGYRRSVVPYTVAKRVAGQSKYTLMQLLRLARSGLFSFSTVPLRISIVIGLVTSVLAFAELVYALGVYLLGSVQPGWTSTVAVISLLFGILFLLLGVQGEYIIRIYQRVQHRPPFIIERTVTRRAD